MTNAILLCMSYCNGDTRKYLNKIKSNFLLQVKDIIVVKRLQRNYRNVSKHLMYTYFGLAKLHIFCNIST